MTLRERMARPETVVVVAIVAFAVLRLAALTRYPLWTDETWTLQAGGSTLRRVIRIHADDQTHPPLFYLVLWAWRRIGPDSLFWVRLLPGLAGIATAVPMLLVARLARMTDRATWLAVLLGAGSGMLVAYSAELRSYAFLAFGGTLSLALWMRGRDAEPGTGAASLTRLTVTNALLVHVHYFGVFVVAAEWLDALLGARRRLRAMTVSAAVTAASLVPWIANTLRRARITGNQLEVVDWVPRPLAGDLFDFAREAIGPSPWLAFDLVVLVVAAAAIAAWAFRALGTPQSAGVRLLLLAALVPVAIALVTSAFGPRSVWVDRYLIASVPPLLLVAAGALDALVPRRWTPVAIGVALMPSAFTALSLARGAAKPRYDLVVREVARLDSGPDVRVYSLGSVNAFPLQYAARDSAALPRPVRVTSVTVDELTQQPAGWAVWSERHPPPGIPPSAALVRRGYALGTPLGFRSAADTLVAQRFWRKGAE